MAFFVDEDQRIIDLERHLQLIIAGGGSDGTHDFALRGADFEISFWARRAVARVEGADPELPAPLRTLVTWTASGINPSPDTDREEVLQIIAEALAAYKFAHGGPEGQLVEVLFSKRSDGR